MSENHRRLSRQAEAVLQAFAEVGGQWRYGLEIAALTELKSGSLYPILARLNERGLLDSQWEPAQPGRPPRHVYRITSKGLEVWEIVRQTEAASQTGGAFA